MFLIYISGIDGCGKTTQAKLLAQWMNAQGWQAEYHWLRWEPSVLALIKAARKFSGAAAKGNEGNNRDTRDIRDIRDKAVRSDVARAAGENDLKGKRAANGESSSENRSYNRWSSLKHRLFSSDLFRRIWLAYAARDYYRAYRRVVGIWHSEYVVLDRYLFDFVVDQSLNFGMGIGEFERRLEGTVLRRMRKPDLRIFIDLPAEVGYARKQDGTPLGYLQKREGCYREVEASESVLHVDGEKSVEEIHSVIAQWVGGKIYAAHNNV